VDGETFGDGTYLVGVDIQPGTYRSDTGEGCYWARLRNFTGGLGSLIANDNPAGPAIVKIGAKDKGFHSQRCGRWTRIAGADAQRTRSRRKREPSEFQLRFNTLK